jgi:hypothetical protein
MKLDLPKTGSREKAVQPGAGIHEVCHRECVLLLSAPKRFLGEMVNGHGRSTRENRHRRPAIHRIDNRFAARFDQLTQFRHELLRMGDVFHYHARAGQGELSGVVKLFKELLVALMSKGVPVDVRGWIDGYQALAPVSQDAGQLGVAWEDCGAAADVEPVVSRFLCKWPFSAFVSASQPLAGSPPT